MAQNINVDITPSLFQPILTYSQGDVGRQFTINVVSKDGYSIPSGATAVIQATKPSGFGFSVDGTVSGNTVSFSTTAEMTDEWGRFPAELKISSGATVLFSANFLMVGEKNTHPEGTIDGSRGTIIPELTLLVERVETAASNILDMNVVANTLPAGSSATYEYDEETNTASFGVPQGEAGGGGTTGVVAPAYDASKTYAVGDFVMHDSNLYKCTTAITTAEAWTAARWTQVVMSGEVTDLKSDLSDIGGALDEPKDSSDFIWTIGKIVDASGGFSNSVGYASFSNILPITEPTLIVNRQGKTGYNGKDHAIGIAIYGDNGFISRTFLTDEGQTYLIPSNAKYYRLMYGYANATGVTITTAILETYFKAQVTHPFGSKEKTDDSFEAIFGEVLTDSREIPLTVGYQINANNGTTGASNYYDATDYIALNGAKMIQFPSPVTTLASVLAGYAFYDSSKSYISGGSIIVGASAEGTQNRALSVPNGAVYFRSSYWKKTYATQQSLPYPPFVLYDITDAIPHKLEKINEVVDVLPLGLHTIPQSNGVLNVIKRCRQMTDIKWTPVIDLPRLNSVSGNFEADPLVVYEGVFKAGKEYTGLPYGRTDGNILGYTYAFVGMEIGFDTFVSSVRNADSSLCKTSRYDATNHKSVKYAVVCSTLSSYAFGWSYTPTQSIPNMPNVTKVADIISNGTRMDLSLIKLGDIVCLPSWHVGIVTDIITNSNGDVSIIEVSEADTCGNGNQSLSGGLDGGICRRRGWTTEDFFETWGTFSIYRFGKIDEVTYTPSKYVNVGDEPNMMRYEEFPCMPYMGEGYKYKSGYITNTDILISCNAYDYLRVFKDGTEITGSPFALTSETTKVSAGFSATGDYIAYLCNMSDGADTIKTQNCHWSVIA